MNPNPEPSSSLPPSAIVCRQGWRDRQLAWAMLIVLAVLIPRGLIIAREHSGSCDDNYHMYRGLLFLQMRWSALANTPMNDPPLGEAISAVPVWINGIHIADPALVGNVHTDAPPIFPNASSRLPQRVEYENAIWKSILFLPACAVIFQWVRSIYSLSSAWLMMGMVLAEPTLAAHLPMPTLDVLGMEGIMIGCWAAWRFVVAPTPRRALTTSAATALALLLKHTALVLPAVIFIYAMLHWLLRLQIWRQPAELWRHVRLLLLATIATPAAIWILMLGNVTVPRVYREHPTLAAGFSHWGFVPAGIYIQSLYEGLAHAAHGSRAYLLSMTNDLGWWYYFPVVATYKIPLGIIALCLLGLASLAWVKWRYEELPLIIAAGAWTEALMTQHINIGFRHALPAEIFLLMLASRVAAKPRKATMAVAWACIAWAAIDVASKTPDYLSYINFERAHPAYLDISDSNIDWGQGLKQLKRWIDRQPRSVGPIYVNYFGEVGINLYDWLGPRLAEYTTSFHTLWLRRPEGGADEITGFVPTHGILVISPVSITGQYDEFIRYQFLGSIPPREVIGNSLLVYDLDRLRELGKLPALFLTPGAVPFPSRARSTASQDSMSRR